MHKRSNELDASVLSAGGLLDPQAALSSSAYLLSLSPSFLRSHCVQALGKRWTRQTSLCSHWNDIRMGTKGNEKTLNIMSDGSKCLGGIKQDKGLVCDAGEVSGGAVLDSVIREDSARQHLSREA